MCEILVSDLKSNLLTLKVHSEDEDFESKEKFYEEIDINSKTLDERHSIDNMKSSYSGGCVWGKEITEMMTETMKIKN